MKRIAFFSITLLLACMAGCDNKIPMEENLWPETVYLVGAKDKIINRDLNIGYEKDTIYASVAISGSLPTKEDITVTVEEFPSGIESYNQKELGSDDIKYRTLTNGIYSFPQENARKVSESSGNALPESSDNSNESQEEDCDAIIKGAGPFGGDVKAKDISFFKDKSLLKGENGKEYKRNDEGKLEELN